MNGIAKRIESRLPLMYTTCLTVRYTVKCRNPLTTSKSQVSTLLGSSLRTTTSCTWPGFRSTALYMLLFCNCTLGTADDAAVDDDDVGSRWSTSTDSSGMVMYSDFGTRQPSWMRLYFGLVVRARNYLVYIKK